MTLMIVAKDSQLFMTKGRGRRMMKASSTDGDAKSDEDESAASAPSIEPSVTLVAM